MNVIEVRRECVPDDWCDTENAHLVLTMGGKGFSPRHITQEVTLEFIERPAQGLSLWILSESPKVTPMVKLSRGVCGIGKGTSIMNLPQRLKESQLKCLQFVLPALPHAIEN